MNKDEMIEQMAKDLVDEIEFDITFYDFNGSVGIHFDYDCTAKNVVEKGYRKVADDEQIVNTEQLTETLNSTLESGKRMGYAKGRDETITAVLKYIDNTIKGFNRANEEANKGLDEVEKEARTMCADAIEEVLKIVRDDLARVYGIELED